MRYFIAAFLFAGCMHHAEGPEVAQMRLRNIQSHTFVGVDAKRMTKEVISVLQDEGYMIKNVSIDVGLLTAEKESNIEKFSSKFWAYFFSGRRGRWKMRSIMELTTNITENEQRTKVRINYLVRIFDNFGRIVDVHQILDETRYTDFFNKVQKGLLTETN